MKSNHVESRLLKIPTGLTLVLFQTRGEWTQLSAAPLQLDLHPSSWNWTGHPPQHVLWASVSFLFGVTDGNCVSLMHISLWPDCTSLPGHALFPKFNLTFPGWPWCRTLGSLCCSPHSTLPHLAPDFQTKKSFRKGSFSYKWSLFHCRKDNEVIALKDFSVFFKEKVHLRNFNKFQY